MFLFKFFIFNIKSLAEELDVFERSRMFRKLTTLDETFVKVNGPEY